MSSAGADIVVIKELKKALHDLNESKQYSDLVVVCGPDEYHVHKAIICTRSKFFANAVQNGKWLEGETGRIILHKDDPECAEENRFLAKEMMGYFYTLNYCDFPPVWDAANTATTKVTNQAPSSSNLPTLDQLGRPSAANAGSSDHHGAVSNIFAPTSTNIFAPFSTAATTPTPLSTTANISTQPTHATYSRYAAVLSRPSSTSIVAASPAAPPPPPSPIPSPSISSPIPADSLYNPVLHANMYALADFYGIQGLKELAKEKYRTAMVISWKTKEAVKSMELAWNSTPSDDRGLRDIVVRTVVSQIEMVGMPDVETLLRELPDLSFEILKSFATQTST
ncbi:hypothetical protein EJ08DRAFT_703502 [Tothia fuscella]|uniref:BTB domain-containing protein n=1 Tax=Tothia fuscella TaxID=1048955 RepID=A0A9P4NEL3_9PEZI|nr:hypothetical protein EJ08DRAFT_703502 [Tothia fuscella]